MGTYNKIMEWFWLSIGILIVIVVSYLCITEGSERWVAYYGLCLFAFGSYFLRRFMRRRMEKHQAFLKQQHAAEQQKSGTENQ